MVLRIHGTFVCINNCIVITMLIIMDAPRVWLRRSLLECLKNGRGEKEQGTGCVPWKKGESRDKPVVGVGERRKKGEGREKEHIGRSSYKRWEILVEGSIRRRC